MTAVLLVHGAWHGAWCWEKVLPLLAEQGVGAKAIDLPGHGANARHGWGVGLDDYARAVASAARELGRAHLVGHSMGGIVIAGAAEMAPEAVGGLTFLAAFLPRPGDSLLRLGAEDGGTLVPTIARTDALAGVSRVDAEGARSVFYGDCSDADVAWAQARLQPQPLRPLIDGARVTAGRFGSVPRFYIGCTQDKAVSHAFQQRMLARVPCRDVVTLETSHSPFMSAPAALAAAIVRFSAAA
jgi:pimeloyl-ACP methyl ester carboxylesterase